MNLFTATTVYHANSGGPASRTRRETVDASLLDDQARPGHCRRLFTLGLLFPVGTDPVDWVEEAMGRAGYADVESLRASLQLPTGGLICTPAPNDLRQYVSAMHDYRVLEQAVMLGLCNAVGYFPQRPVLWTRTALSRSLFLYDPEGFYQ